MNETSETIMLSKEDLFYALMKTHTLVGPFDVKTNADEWFSFFMHQLGFDAGLVN